MSGELRPVWVCVGDDCGLRVRNVDGRPIPEPKKWEDGHCVACRVEAERITNGQAAANKLHDKLHGIRKRPKPFSHSSPEFGGSGDKPPDEKRKQVGGSRIKQPTPEQADQIDRALETEFDTDRAIAENVGVPVARVREARQRLGLPNAPERRVAARTAKLKAFLAEDPTRLDWKTEAIAEAIGEEPAKVRTDRLHLGLNPRRKRQASEMAKSAT